MVINTDLLDFVSVHGLLGTDAPALRIPDFQRPYSWTPRVAAQLFTDVGEALRDRPEHPYMMGTVILLKRREDTHFEVVDGQQRLLTLYLLRALLRGEAIAHLESGSTPIHLVYRELSRRVADLSRSDEQLSGYRTLLDAQSKVLRIVT
ncbi:MAG TPA: DUF262 domain-containing protein, partial [Jiangellaceae bacterium]|nr:DUF262 domain-containing protein [Jiangellaceae bacterium]